VKHHGTTPYGIHFKHYASSATMSSLSDISALLCVSTSFIIRYKALVYLEVKKALSWPNSPSS